MAVGTLRVRQPIADTVSRVPERLRELEQRYERMKLVSLALWQLLKSHTGLTDADLKQYILDGRIDSKGAAMDCPTCKRRILKSAVVCPWCSERTRSGTLSRRLESGSELQVQRLTVPLTNDDRPLRSRRVTARPW